MNTIVFSDFDGTITEQETFSLLMQEFAPDASRAIIPKLLSGEIPLRDGVPAILETISSDRFADMQERMRLAPLRPGFPEFLDLLDRYKVPLIVLSGSLEDLVLARLAPFRTRVFRVIAAQADTSGPFLQISSDSAGEDELVYKPGILKEYPEARKIAIGDSVTDLAMARMADQVFARSILADRLSKEGRPFTKFDTFFDISRNIEIILKSGGRDA